MALQPIAGFSALSTHHCITGSLRNIYTFHGIDLSEEMLLGLGSGVGFIYWQTKGVPPLFGGRANFERPGQAGLEKTVGERTGVSVVPHHTGNKRVAEAALLDLLSQGEPVMVYVDMGFLPYLELPEGYHFGGHAVVVAGIDDDLRQVLVADRDGLLHTVPLGALRDARGSRFKPFPPRNGWYTFDFTHARDPQPDEVRQAICEVTQGMVRPPISNIGVKGIRKAAERVRSWPATMNLDDLRTACATVFFYIDSAGGTGGGIFRYMYGRFLAEAAGLLGLPALAESGDEFHSIGDRWQEVAAFFTQAGDAANATPALTSAAAYLLEIADREERAWLHLESLLN